MGIVCRAVELASRVALSSYSLISNHTVCACAWIQNISSGNSSAGMLDAGGGPRQASRCKSENEQVFYVKMQGTGDILHVGRLKKRPDISDFITAVEGSVDSGTAVAKKARKVDTCSRCKLDGHK